MHELFITALASEVTSIDNIKLPFYSPFFCKSIFKVSLMLANEYQDLTVCQVAKVFHFPKSLRISLVIQIWNMFQMFGFYAFL